MNFSFGKKVIYALGQFGLVLCGYGVSKLFISFFVSGSFPGSRMFPSYLPQGYFFGFFTVAGLIVAICKLVDATAGMYFGFASDRNKMKKGRRTGMMLVAILPFTILSVLVFSPPSVHATALNAVTVLFSAVFFYIFLAMYSIPYYALLAELGTMPEDRMLISTLMAFSTACASLLGNRIFWMMDKIEIVFNLSSLAGFRTILIVFAGISCICMMIPALFINEKKYSEDMPIKGSFSGAVAGVFNDSWFKHYLLADFLYRTASSLVITGFSLYVTTLLGLSEKAALFFLFLLFIATLILYVPVCMMANIFGKRRILAWAFFLFIFVLVLAFFAGMYPFSRYVQGILLSILVAVPISVFSVIPNALIADLAVATERKSGEQRAGMYFGVQSFAEKIGQMLTFLVFQPLTAIGVVSAGDGQTGRSGLRITIIVAAVLSLAGVISLFGYKEKEVSAIIEKKILRRLQKTDDSF